MYEIIASIFVLLLGLIIGSFSNVCIYRIPRNESLIRPGSHCPKCNQPIKFYDNIPLVSFIILKGKCRYCKEKISWQYPLVEFLTAVLYLLLFLRYGLQLVTFVYMFFCSALIIITFIDLKENIIPDVLSLPFLLLGFLMSFFLKNLSPINSLLGILAGGGVLLLVAILGSFLFKKEAMGGGDIKLAAMVGAFLGWQLTLLSLFLSFFTGAIIGIVILIKNKGESDPIPFGPFIALGTIIALFFGNSIINWYLSLVIHL
ncbi:MAG TPA: prepilin peptidase [Candidatus Atribacteria bacterium]|nr:prepilin peptidase [Candidatus Atribacteria bacterium]